MTRIFRSFVLFLGVMSFAGCMTSRSRCEIVYDRPTDVISSSAEPNTIQKYRIREVRDVAGSFSLNDSVMQNVVGSFNSIDQIMHTCPGVFEKNGNEVIVNIVSYDRKIKHNWTVIPCILTVGICPYFQRDDIKVTAEVALIDNPSKKARFSYNQIDDWKISFLFQFGLIPYPEGPLKKSRIGKRGNGDISAEIHRAGLAFGVTKALMEIEKNQ